MNTIINQSDVELRIDDTLPTQPPPPPSAPQPPQQLRFDDKPITLGHRLFSRLFFVNILIIIGKFWKHSGKLSMKQCPMANEDEIFSGRRLEFERSIIRIDDEEQLKQSYFSPDFKCIIYLLTAFKKDIIIIFILLLCEMFSRIAIPITVQILLGNNDSPYKEGVTVGLVSLLVIGMVLRHYNGNYGHEIGLKMRTLIIKTLYGKIQKLHSSTFSEENYLSRIDQHLSKDIQNIEQKMFFLLITLTMPFTLLCSAGLLIYWNGLTGLIGFVYFLLMFLVHIVINLSMNKHLVSANSIAKQKLILLKQTLKGIRIIKISTWEKAFYEMMSVLKDKETYQIFMRYLLLFIERSISLSSPAVASMLIFLANFYIEGDLVFAETFATLQLLLSIRFNVMYFSQMGIDYFYELKDFFKEFRATLKKDQFTMYNESEQLVRLIEPPATSPNCVVLENTSISCSETKIALHNVNLELKKGHKYTLSGPTGSGKSTLFLFLIRQAHHYLSTRVEITKSVAFVGQQHFLMKDTIRNNILFGKQFNEDLYKRVVYATCLFDDLRKMSVTGLGDQTPLLDGGGNLSGGQKTRIVLARALYQEKDLYLLDNVLADLNSEVASAIVKRVFQGLLREKTIVLSTADRTKYDHIMNAHLKIEQKEQNNMLIAEHLPPPQQEFNEPWMVNFEIQQIEGQKPEPPPNVQQQTSSSTYFKYANLWSNWYKWLGVLVLFICGQVIFSMFVYHLKNLTKNTIEVWNEQWGICLGLSFLLGVCYLLKYLSLVSLILGQNKTVFKSMFSRVLQCKLNSLEKTSETQIQQRFDGDMKSVDNIMPTFVCDSFEAPLLFLNMLITVCIIVRIFIPFGVAVTIGNILLYKLCVVSLSKTRKLDLRTKVPIRSSFQQYYQGALQIRCYGAQNHYNQKFKHKVIDYYRANLLYGNVQRATAFIIQACTMVASIIGIVLIYNINENDSTAQDLLYVIALSDYIQFGIRQIALLDGQLMNIQKVFELEKVQKESEEFYNKEEELTTTQQQSLSIEFRDVVMKYPNGKVALNKVNFLIEKGEKIGIIGRTGAGKTSLLNALFRFQDLESGEILIDKVSHVEIPLGRLRNMFGVIPQNPFLFKSTLKKNIDPEGKYLQEHICQVLESVFGKKFDSESLNSSAQNLSAGEKQLITVCRSLLNRPKILILDEATSSMDQEGSQKFISLINNQYKCTTLSIAHIIRTVEDCKRLIVMDDGRAEVFKIFENYRELLRHQLILD